MLWLVKWQDRYCHCIIHKTLFGSNPWHSNLTYKYNLHIMYTIYSPYWTNSPKNRCNHNLLNLWWAIGLKCQDRLIIMQVYNLNLHHAQTPWKKCWYFHGRGAVASSDPSVKPPHVTEKSLHLLKDTSCPMGLLKTGQNQISLLWHRQNTMDLCVIDMIWVFYQTTGGNRLLFLTGKLSVDLHSYVQLSWSWTLAIDWEKT